MGLMTLSPLVAHDRAAYESVWRARQTFSWRLLFAEAMESDFQLYYAQRYRVHMRLALAVGALGLLLSVFEDFLVPAAERDFPLFLRLVVSFPIVCLLYILIQLPSLARWQQAMLMFSTIGGATAFMLMAFFVASPMGRIYIDTVMLIQIFGLVLLRMQFSYALPSVLVIVSGVSFALLNMPFPGSRHSHLIDLMLIAFAGLLCLVANYLIERSVRSDYLQQRMLEFHRQDLENTNQYLQKLLRSDALTGIFNRRHFDSHLADEFRRAERSGDAVALLMLDVDYFKLYNDTYGHQAGDEVLAMVAKTLAAFSRRPGDVAARYGGEEFSLILPGTSEADAMAIAEEIVASIFSQNIAHKSSRISDRLTVSIGVASLQPDGLAQNEAALIANADQAMYLAKNTGRNRARSWSSLTEK